MLERGKAMAGDEPQYIETGGTGVERTRRRKKTRERGAAHVTITPYVPRAHALAVVALSLPVAQRASTQQLPSRDPKPNKQTGRRGPVWNSRTRMLWKKSEDEGRKGSGGCWTSRARAGARRGPARPRRFFCVFVASRWEVVVSFEHHVGLRKRTRMRNREEAG